MAFIPTPSLTVELAMEQLRLGCVTATELLQCSLARIQQREPLVQAWQSLGIAPARARAALLDSTWQEEGELPPLHGVPVGVKDIFATPDLPTTWGSPMFGDRYLSETAAAVERLERAGALILGKTVSTEFATAAAGPTRNPHNLSHTPGGSSSGSAAAVADGMVPVAIGSQTMGSVLRPAAYCGIFGFKPSFGAISRYGMLSVCRDLDHVGVFARCLADIRRLVSVLAGADSRDPDCRGVPHYSDMTGYPNSPRIGWLQGPDWDGVDSESQSRLCEAVEVLRAGGAVISNVSLPPVFQHAWNDSKVLCACGLAASHGDTIKRHRGQVSDLLWSWVELGYQSSPLAYARARQRGILYRQAIVEMSARYDALLTPVTDSAAPEGLGSTGTPRFCALWTLCGVPALNLPVGLNAIGLPLSCQLVGFPQQDFQLLQVADWCWPLLQQAFGGIRTPG